MDRQLRWHVPHELCWAMWFLQLLFSPGRVVLAAAVLAAVLAGQSGACSS